METIFLDARDRWFDSCWHYISTNESSSFNILFLHDKFLNKICKVHQNFTSKKLTSYAIKSVPINQN